MTKIKLCGLFRSDDITAANAAHPDYAGFVVNFPASHRSVSLGAAKQLAAALEPGIHSVAVMVDQPPVVAAEALRTFCCVQLHGAEDDAYIAQVRQLAGVAPNEDAPRIFKAFRIRTDRDLFPAVMSSADAIVLDAGMGGGVPFDHTVIPADFPRPYMLAGGLVPENAAEAVAALAPWGVDVSSGIETNKQKDSAKMAAFVAAVREADEKEQQ